jgi:hypothetical protein
VSRGSDHTHGLGLVAFLAPSDLELDALALFQSVLPVALNRREMHEQVVALLAREKAVALVGVENLTVPCATLTS